MIIKSKDYCPHCRRRTEGLKDYEAKEYLCKRCGKISKLNTIDSLGCSKNTPIKLKDNYLNWFKKRIV